MKDQPILLTLNPRPQNLGNFGKESYDVAEILHYVQDRATANRTRFHIVAQGREAQPWVGKVKNT